MIQHFLDYIAIERRYSPKTVLAYTNDLRDFCRFFGWETEAFDPKQLDENDIKLWMIDLLEQQHNSPRSVKRKLCCLKSFYKFLLRTGQIKKDITQRIISPKTDKPLPVFFKESEMEQVAQIHADEDDFDSVRNALIIQMLYQTGMRRAELINLTDKDIDTREGQIRVFGKRSKERIVPIGEHLIQQIEHYQDLRRQLIAERGESIDAFWVQQTQKRLNKLTINQLYTIVRSLMGEVSTLHKHSPHVLRHTFATTMLNNGADIRTIQTLLGHASLASTQVYTHTTFEQIKQSYLSAHPRARRKK